MLTLSSVEFLLLMLPEFILDTDTIGWGGKHAFTNLPEDMHMVGHLDHDTHWWDTP